MSNVVYVLPALACPIGMLLMMVMMGKGMSGRGKRGGAERVASLDELRHEHAKLGSEIERLERDRRSEPADRPASMVDAT